MRARFSSGGFTIVEMIIFLAASTALFAIAFSAFNGQQQRTQFSQGVRDLEQKLRDVANDVATGYFPSSADFTCTNGPNFSIATQTSQGENEACIFVGRVVHFGGNSSSTDCNIPSLSACDDIDIYTLAGNRQQQVGTNTVDVDSIASSNPTAISNVNDPEVDVTEHYATRHGAQITRVLVNNTDGTKTDIGALGFMNNFDGSGGLTVSGSNTTEIYRFGNTVIGATEDNVVTAIEKVGIPTETQIASGMANGVVVCLRSPYDGQVAAVLFGANGSALTTSSIFNQEAEAQGCA